MGECVREFTPVEVVRNEILNFLESKDLVLNDEMQKCVEEIFAYGISYEHEHRKRSTDYYQNQLKELNEENRLMKTQLRILTKYIEGHEI